MDIGGIYIVYRGLKPFYIPKERRGPEAPVRKEINSKPSFCTAVSWQHSSSYCSHRDQRRPASDFTIVLKPY